MISKEEKYYKQEEAKAKNHTYKKIVLNNHRNSNIMQIKKDRLNYLISTFKN